MSKLMYTRQDNEKHSTTFLTGVVEKVAVPDSDSRHPHRITIKTRAQQNDGSKKWEDITLDLVAWDKNAERMDRMKFDIGSYAMFRVGDITEYTPKSGEPILQANYFSSVYTGYWDIDDSDRPDLLSLIGYPTEITENADGSASINTKVRSFEDGQRTDLFFTLNVKANAYANMKKAGFNKFCTIAAVGTMVSDDTMNVGIVDFFNRPRPEKSKSGSSRGSGSGRGSSRGSGGYSSGNRGTAKKWGGATNSFGDDE